MACEGEVRHIPEGVDGNFVQDPEIGTASVDHNGDPIDSGYFTFDPDGMSTINWMPKGVQVSEYSRASRGDIGSDPSHKPTGSSAIPIPEESCKSLNFTQRLVENQPTGGPKRLTQPNSSAVNINESSSADTI